MRTKIDWAELHAPLFLAGTNLGQKLNPAQKSGLSMEYDEEKRHLYVSYNGKTARIPETSVLSMNEAPAVAVVKEEAPVVAPQPFNAFAAQVDSPTAHVFAGLGKGQSGQGAKVK